MTNPSTEPVAAIAALLNETTETEKQGEDH